MWWWNFWGNPVKLLLPSGPSASPEGESPFASWCVWGLVLSKLRAEQHARGKPNSTLYTDSYVIEANWSFPNSMFPRRAGTYPHERNEPIIIRIVNDNSNDSNDDNTRIMIMIVIMIRMIVGYSCTPDVSRKIWILPPFCLVGDTSGGWCGKQVHVMMKLWGNMVKFLL